MRKLFVMITGQYRTFWHCWHNTVANIIRPAKESQYDPYVLVGIDKVWASVGVRWGDAERTTFETHLRNEWEVLRFPPDHLTVVWIDHQKDPYFRMSVSSLEGHKRNGDLSEYWFEYLTQRSGSCAEYAQACRLLDEISDKHTIGKEDLLLRTRTDVLLRHRINLHGVSEATNTTANAFQHLFPSCDHFDHLAEKDDREASIHPDKPSPDRWAITLRKNLIYLIPARSAWFLRDVVRRYGDWDTPRENAYWFNAESQFRGCLRRHGFRVLEFSQQSDQCYGGALGDEFPVYAIYR